MMVPQFSFWLLFVAIVHCLVFPTAINAELAFVRPNTSVPCAGSQQPCLTFNEYAQVDQYFVDNTTFLFLPGTHQLDVELDLKSLSNIAFVPALGLDEGINDAVQLLIDPSVNITWTNCENIVVSGLVFIISGQFSFGIDLSPELIFQNTTSFSLANLTLIGNGSRLFVLCWFSGIQIGNLAVIDSRAPTLCAIDSTIIFYGQNTFFNNTIKVTVKPSLVQTGRSLIQLNDRSTCYIYGNISFIQNNIYAVSNPDFPSFLVTGGAAISVNYRSTLVISGIALFVQNRATASIPGLHGSIPLTGGAICSIQSKVIFEESSDISFVENSATSGSDGAGGAIYTLDSNLTMYGRVLFEGNSADTGGAIYAQGYFYVTTSSVELSSRDVWFNRNTALLNGGAVYVSNTLINMTGALHFIKNSAQRGGAIAFISHSSYDSNGYFTSSSKLLLTEPLMAEFIENLANMSGGVIFFDEGNIGISRSCDKNPDIISYCFIEFSSRDNISLNFDNNSAEKAGRILYGGNLDTCTPSVSGRLLFADRALNIIASFSNVNVNVSNYKDNTTSNVSSDTLQVCICEKYGLVCNHTEIETVTGSEFTLQAVIVGQGLGAVPSNVRISLDNDAQLGSPGQRIQPTGKTCTNITYSLLAEKNTTVVTLFPNNGPCSNYGIGRTSINVTFLPCPNGFTKTGSECVCDKRLQRFNALCHVNNKIIQWTSTSNHFWVGALYDSNESIYEGLILHAGCPLDYCVDHPVPITLDNLDIQCNHSHSGTLCGSCKEGYSIILGTLHCRRCKNDYLALILLFAIAGIALVAFVLLLGLTVTAGTINGLIFYANVIHANQYVFFPVGTRQLLAWFNLDLGFQICFYDGMTIYAYTWLQFVFPFYVWFLIGLIIVATHYLSKLTKILGNNPVAALATLLLLSYSKVLRAILDALTSTELQYPGGKMKLVWLYDGNVTYGRGGHLVLAIFAILVLVFLFIPYTLLLFFAHWLQALSHWRILSWLNKIKPFTDTYHAPFKKQTRYWTGLFLFVRHSLFAIHAISRELTPIVITAITAILLSMAWMHKGIYESRLNDIFEAFFLVNLCIFAAITNQNIASFRQAEVGYFFVGIALAGYGCIVLHHIYLKIGSIKLCNFIRREKKKEVSVLAPALNDGNCQQSLNGLDAAKFPPTQTIIPLREPLLEL